MIPTLEQKLAWLKLAPIPGGGRGGHSMTRLCDGTFLVYGGGVWPATAADGWIYAPN